MKYGFIVIMMLLGCGLAVAGQANAPAKPLTPLEQTLVSAEKSFIEAAKKGDAAFFKRTLADDFTWVDFAGELADRQDMIDGMSGGGFDVLAYDMKVVPVSDGVAIVTYNVVLRVPPSEDQGPPPRYQHFSTTWVKQGDVWKMKFQQMTVAHYGDW
jgi:ketosteroid isomerase-like protein